MGVFKPSGEGERRGSSTSSQHRSVHSSYIYPHGQQLYLSGMPQEPRVCGVISVLRKNTIWMPFSCKPSLLPAPGAFTTISGLLCSSFHPTSSTMVMLGSSSLCPSHTPLSGLPFPQPLGADISSFLSPRELFLLLMGVGHPLATLFTQPAVSASLWDSQLASQVTESHKT